MTLFKKSKKDSKKLDGEVKEDGGSGAKPLGESKALKKFRMKFKC